MSSCVGAPPPHLNCVHGKACDWIAPKPIKYRSTGPGVKGMHVPKIDTGPPPPQPALNRRQRREQERQARRKYP